MPAILKPEPHKRVKARKQRHAAKVVKSVRAQCVERDVYCRAGWNERIRDIGVNAFECAGPSEWAHLGEQKRFKTRGQPPEVRHTTAGSLMLCRKHHAEYDQGRLAIQGDANGLLTMTRTGR